MQQVCDAPSGKLGSRGGYAWEVASCGCGQHTASMHTERMSAPVVLGQRRASSSKRMSRSQFIEPGRGAKVRGEGEG